MTPPPQPLWYYSDDQKEVLEEDWKARDKQRVARELTLARKKAGALREFIKWAEDEIGLPADTDGEDEKVDNAEGSPVSKKARLE